MKRKSKVWDSEVFGLSFLDCICCGFGAVILLFVITTREDGHVVVETTGVFEAEVDKAEKQLDEGRINMFRLVNTIKEIEKEIEETSGLSSTVIEHIELTKREVAEKNKRSQTQIETLAKLDSDLEQVETETRKLQAGPTEDSGKAVRPSIGTERRHYLTGLKVDGKRSVILVDASLSMLDDNFQKVARYYKNASPSQKLQSAKWIRVLDSVDWLMATMESDEYQIYLYNEDVRSALPGSEGSWLKKSDFMQVQDVANCFWNFPPDGGSNLERALAKVYELSPAPDNIFILTDGLPNHSTSGAPARTMVSMKAREKHFLNAYRRIGSRSAPINTIMFPFEGEPSAPFYYWLMARETGGAFFVPAKGWPN